MSYTRRPLCVLVMGRGHLQQLEPESGGGAAFRAAPAVGGGSTWKGQ